MEYRNGDRMALAHTIAVCGKLGIPLPEWAVAAFVAGYRDLLNYHPTSWENIFGPAIPKGQHLNALRKRHQKSFIVWLEVQHQHKTGRAIDDELFGEVGKKHGIGTTLAKEYYTDEKRAMRRIRDRLARVDKEVTAWSRERLEAADQALDAGRLELARKLFDGVKRRLDSHFGSNAQRK
jgi:hypothetical protein